MVWLKLAAGILGALALLLVVGIFVVQAVALRRFHPPTADDPRYQEKM